MHQPGARTEGNNLKKIVVAFLATLALTLSVSTSAEAASAGWVAGGGNDLQNGNLSSSLYMSSSAVTKARATYDKKKGSGVSVKFGFQAVSKKGNAQGPVSWSGTYKLKSKQKKTATFSGHAALSSKRPCARALMKDTISGKIYYTKTISCTGR